MFALGIAVSGVALLAFPASNPLLDVLPSWLRHVWYSLYVVSGTTLSVGILRAIPRLEAVGHGLITALFLGSAYLELTQAPSVGDAISGVTLTLLLTAGSAFRFVLLIRYAPATSERHGP